MAAGIPLPPEALYNCCDADQFGFETTAELADVGKVLGQNRAGEAIQLGVAVDYHGYNLSAHYVSDQPLSLLASLVFEQSYAGIEGASASAAELCALLSALAQLPIKQSLAVTGSVNQYDQVQAIRAVNDKIEGFFDICQARGLQSDQGVLIPAANVKHLMLRQEVVEAVAAGQFQIHAVETIDQCMEILTGLVAGERDEAGEFPESTINQQIVAGLLDYAQKRRLFEADLAELADT